MSISTTTLIGGRWLDAGRPHDVTSPADGTVVGRVNYGGPAEATAAAAAAADAFGTWASTTARQRADLLRTVANRLGAEAERIGTLLARESGKRRPEGIGEVRFAAEYFRWFAEQARRSHGEVIPNETHENRHITVRRPVGVALSLTPWNFPVSIQARKLAPALAAGCTVVARPSEKAPLAVVEMFRLLQDAGLPEGVVNLVHGPAAELTTALLAHPAVRVVSFTGSTEVGRLIMRQAAERVVRPALELGGDAAFIVHDDADLDAAVRGALLAKFRNNGQSCIAANRFLVHRSVYDEFVTRLVTEVDAMRVGDGCGEPVPDLGPLIDQERVDAVRNLVTDALERGAKQVTRDFDLPATGSFAAPALLSDVPADALLARTEVFGPAAGIFPFGTDDEALTLANSTEMGLAAYVYSRDIGRCWRFGEHLQAGIIGINNPLPSVAYAPMGGVKQSGLGREGGASGLEEFEDIRYLAVTL